MDKDKLTQEELVSSLTTWKALADIAVKLDGYYKDKAEQAYTQLKEIVEWYFDNGGAQIVGDLKKTEDWEMEI